MRIQELALAFALMAGGCATGHQPGVVTPLTPPAEGVVASTVTTDGLNADCFYRPSPRPRRALILLGGSEGGKGWSRQPAYVDQLVEAGYFVLSVAYFGAEGLPDKQRALPVEYFEKVFHWLARQEGVIPDDYVVMGASRGAELALLLASIYPQVKAVVAIAPSSVVFPGPPTGLFDAVRGQHSAWSRGGREVPFLRIPCSWATLRGMMSGNRTRMFEQALARPRGHEQAEIAVEQARGPILLVSFTQDQIWPSTLMAGQIMGRLAAHGFAFEYQHHAYPRKHSDWSFAPCWTCIRTFLGQQAQPPAGQPVTPGGTSS